MKTYEVPCWMVCAWSGRESGYHLYGSGRALGFVRMATNLLAGLGWKHQKEAEYHAYAGISAVRSAIDSAACWLNSELEVGQPHGPGLDLTKPAFRKKLTQKNSGLGDHIDSLGALGKQIAYPRNLMQHRGGSPVRFHADSEKLNEKSGWFLISQDSLAGPESDLRLTKLLQDSAHHIEKDLFLCHHEVLCSTPGDDYDKICSDKGILASAGAWEVPLQLDCPYHS